MKSRNYDTKLADGLTFKNTTVCKSTLVNVRFSKNMEKRKQASRQKRKHNKLCKYLLYKI